MLIGGANIDATYLDDRSAKHWRDLWLRVDGPEACSQPLLRQPVPLVEAAQARSFGR